MASRMAVKILAASSSRWSLAFSSTKAPMNTGGVTMRKAVRRLSSNSPDSPKTISGAAAWPNTTDARLKAPNPAPRRLAGTASDSPARSAGTDMAMTKKPTSCRG